MYPSHLAGGLPPLMAANQQLKNGENVAADRTLRAAGYSWDDLTHARRSGALGDTIVQDQPPPFIRPAWDEGVIYIQGHKVALVPALLTALTVKVILFSGKQAAKGAKRLTRRRATA